MAKRILCLIVAIAMIGTLAICAGAEGGKAWIGGTFEVDGENVDWVEFKDQTTTFEVGKPFTLTFEPGDLEVIFDEADWGYICVVQTNMGSSKDDAEKYDAYFNKITIDGKNVPFNKDNIKTGWGDGGESAIRISLIDGWNEGSGIVSSISAIGEIESKLEIEMAFVAAGAAAPNFSATPESTTPAATTAGGATTGGGLPLDTGVQGVLALGGVAVLAAGGILISRKRK